MSEPKMVQVDAAYIEKLEAVAEKSEVYHRAALEMDRAFIADEPDKMDKSDAYLKAIDEYEAALAALKEAQDESK